MKFKFKNRKKSSVADVDKPEKENTPETTGVNKKNKRKSPEEKSEENDSGLQSAKRSKKEKKVQSVSEETHSEEIQPEEIISKGNDVDSQSAKKSKKKKKKNKPKLEENHVEEEQSTADVSENTDVESQSTKKSKKRKKNQPDIEDKQSAEVISENTDGKSPSKKKQKKKKKKNQSAVEENHVDEQDDEAVSKSNEIESLFVEKPKKNIDAGANQNAEKTSKNDEKHAGQKSDLSKNKNKTDSATGKKLSLPYQIKEEQESRTIFIGNLPVKFNNKNFTKLVGEYGKTETIRIRGAIPECDKISKKVAVNKKMFYKDQQSLIAYVRYQTVEEAQNALNLNGQIFEGRHLRVTLPTEKISDKNKGIFVGNLRFKVTDEELWDLFKDCGEILSVRVIRDNNTGFCKGFGYVNFKSEDSVEFALKLDGEKLLDREIRIKRLFSAGKIDKLRKKRERSNVPNNQPNKSFNPKNEKTTGFKPGFNKKFKSNTDKTSNDKPNFKFKKQKNNVSKVDLKKKKLAEKLLAKSKKKPVASE